MELVRELTGWVDKARMTVSGTEATMHAMRVARAYTGRDKIVKFEGQYHGVHDYALISVSPGRHVRAGRRGQPRSAWPGAAASPTRSPTRSSRPATTTSRPCAGCSSARGDEIAAIIVEPVLGNAQGILPEAGLPPGDAGADRGVRDPAHLRRGQDRVPLRPGRRGRVLRDHAGPRDLRQGDGQRLPGGGVRRPRRGHERPARQGQPRRHVRRQPGRRRGRGQDADDPHATRTPSRPSTRPAGGSRPVCRETARRRRASRTTSPATRAMFGIMFTRARSRPSTATGRPRDHELYDAIAVGMHARGAMPEPDSREPWFMCEAHAQGDIVDRVISIFSDSLDAALEARAHGAVASQRLTAACQRRGRLPTERAGRRWSSTATPSARSIGRRPSCSRSATARARPASPSSPAGSASTSRRRRACWPRSRSAASSSRTTRPASTASASSSSASPSGRSGRSTCAGSPCPSWSASPG